MQRRVLGPENPKTLRTLDGLGRVAIKQGKASEAEALMSTSLEPSRRVLGTENRETLTRMQNLAFVYGAEASTRGPRQFTARPWRSAAACWVQRAAKPWRP